MFTVKSSPTKGFAVVATAIHAGHELRSEIEGAFLLDAVVRRREEDPYTERIALAAPVSVTVHRSRFEVDLNRPRSGAVYEGPDDAWGLELWARPLDAAVVERSCLEHDDFYAMMRGLLDPLALAGPFVVLDVHSYNHRRGGQEALPASPTENPEVNVGTGSLDRARWGSLVDRFIEDLGRCEVAGHRLDVRENVKFRGGYLTAWIHEHYRGFGCAIALEFKKTFMDEWTGAADDEHLDQLARAVTTTLPGLQMALAASR